MEGWAGFRVLRKFKALKERLKVWNREEFGDIKLKLDSVAEKLSYLDKIAEDRQLNDEERVRWKEWKAVLVYSILIVIFLDIVIIV